MKRFNTDRDCILGGLHDYYYVGYNYHGSRKDEDIHQCKRCGRFSYRS